MLSKFILVLLPSIAAAAAHSPFDSVFFEPNQGQSVAQVRYLARAPRALLGFREDAIWIDGGGERVLLRFAGASRNARLEPVDETPGRTSYYVGSDKANCVCDVPHYRELAWRGVYPGIDAIFYGSEGRLEYDLVVAPGADLSRVRLRFEGAGPIRFTDDGTLVVRRGRFEFRMPRPHVYQDRREVQGAYRLLASGDVRFLVGAYDHHRELVVDPVFQFAYYAGGERDDSVVAVTPNGDIVGNTSSSSFGRLSTGKAVFVQVAQVQSLGGFLLIFSGAGDVVATSAGSSSRGVTIGGWSTATDYPDAHPLGGIDAFLISITRGQPGASSYAIRIGGSGDDRINAVSGDMTAGTAYFAGETTSSDLRFDGTLYSQPAGGKDAFVGTASFGTVQRLAYYGGSGDDSAYAITVIGGRIYIAGKTTSTDLPLKNPLQGQLSGPSDGFIASFNSIYGQSPILFFATYLGGSGDDEIRGLASPIAASAVFFVGTTTSTDFPVVNAAQPQYGGGASDAFAGQMSYAGQSLSYLTYIGGSGTDVASGAGLNGILDLVVAGSTTSADLPVVNATQSTLAGPQDAWFASLDAGGILQCLSYFGGSGSDRALGIALNSPNQITLVGETDSTDLPTNGSATVPSGGLDGFVAQFTLPRFATAGASTIWTANGLMTTSSFFVSVPSATAMLSVTSSDPSKVLVSLPNGSLPSGSLVAPTRSLITSGGSGTVQIQVTGVADSGEAQVTVTIDGMGSQAIQVQLGPLAIQPFPPSTQLYSVDTPATLFPAAGTVDGSGTFWYGSVVNATAPVVTYSVGDPSAAQLTNPVYGFSGISLPSVTPLKGGDVVVSATVSGAVLFGPSSATYTFQVPSISLPDFAAGNGLLTPESVTESRRLNSGFPITVTSDSPDKLCVMADVFSSCGASTVSAQGYFAVRAFTDSGTATIRYSNNVLGSGTGTVQLTPPKLFLAPAFNTANFSVGSSGFIYVTPGSTLDSQGAAKFPQGSSPNVTVTSSDPNVVSVSSLSTPAENYAIQAVGTGTATLKATSAGFVDADPISVTVVPAPLPALRTFRLSVTSNVVGKDLQCAVSISGPPLSSTIHVTSSAPDLVVVSKESVTPGGAQIDISNTISFYIQALASQGSAVVTVSLAGYADSTIPITVAPSGFAWSSMAASVQAYNSINLTYGSYSLDPVSLGPLTPELLRPGVTAAPTVTSTNAAAGTLASAQNGWTFSANGPGQTFVTLTQPAGFTAPSVRNQELIVVNAGTLTANIPAFLGRDLQLPFNIAAGRGVPVTITSDDPTRLLLSSDPKSPGSASVTAKAAYSLPGGSTGDTVYMQGLTDSGTVMVHMTTDGMAEAIFPVTLVPTGLRFISGYSQIPGLQLTTLSPDTSVSIAAFADSPGMASGGVTTLRPGIPPLSIPLSSTQSSVAFPVSASVTLTPGNVPSAQFNVRPQNPGNATIQMQVPASFRGRTDGTSIAVKVGRPSIPPSQVNAYQGIATRISLPPPSNFQLPGAILLTLVSSDPTVMLLSSSSAQAGRAQISVSYGPQGGVAYVQGIAAGAASIKISAAGFDDSQYSVAVGLPQITLAATPNPAYLGRSAQLIVSTVGTVLPGTQMTVNVQTTNPQVAVVVSPVVIPAGQSQGTAALTVLSQGQATFQADGTGFATASTLSVTLNVALPPLGFALSASGSLGRNLEQLFSLQQFPSGPATVTVGSSDPTTALISSDPKATGTGTLTLQMPQYGSVTFYVQALADHGTATVTLSAPGFAPMAVSINLYPTAFRFGQQVVNATKGIPVTFSIAPEIVAPSAYPEPEMLWTSANIAISSSQPGVGSLSPASLTLNPGDLSGMITFTPATSGSTILTLSPPPGFVQTNPPSQLVVTVQ